MSKPGNVFTTSKGRKVRFVERHQDIASDFWYLDTDTGREFDVRELPAKYISDDRAAVGRGDREAHRRVIQRALKDAYDFKRK